MNDFGSFNLKTLIPLAVSSMLIASGCSPERSAARKYCTMSHECDEDGFDDEFDSIGECVKLKKLEAKASNYALEIDESPECARAVQRAQVCSAKQLTCDAFPGDDADLSDLGDFADWAEDTADACEDRFEDAADACSSGSDNYYL